MKFFIIILINSIIFIPLNASAYIGPGLGFGVSTLILVVLISIFASLIYLLLGFIQKIFGKKKIEDRKKINIDD